jgi:hemerythrin-like domain-containing protein
MNIEDPIHRLRQEHDATLEVVDSMELAVADLLGPRQEEAYATLRGGLEYLEREVREHGQVEEKVLYPALRRHVPRQTIEVMLEEHKDLWWAMDLLAKALAPPAPSVNEVRWQGTALVDLLRRHIDKENNVLFMMVAQMLSDQEYRALAEALEHTLQARKQNA